VEGHHGGPGADASSAPQEVRHLGHPSRAPPVRRRQQRGGRSSGRGTGGDDAEGRDFQRRWRRKEQTCSRCAGAAGAVAGAGRAEPPRGGVHPQVQHGDAAAAAGVAQALQRHDWQGQGQPLVGITAARKKDSAFLFRDISRFWFLVSVRYGFV
jgi:hypothetical protein